MNILLGLVFALFVMISDNAVAELYKQIDEHGNVTYTDAPGKGPGKGEPEKLEPEPITTIESVPTRDDSASTTSEPGSDTMQSDTSPSRITRYSSLEITQPINDATIRANGGSIPVSIASTPALNTDANHRIAIFLDGQRHQESSSTSFEVSNLDRGTHSVSVQIEDADGNLLISSSPVTVHIQKFSALHPRP